MGEAQYYFKIYYPTEEEAKRNLPKVRKFFEEGSKAYDYWQKNRHLKEGHVFWRGFEKKFPMVNEYLVQDGAGLDHNNGPAGKLDFGMEDEIESMFVRGNAVCYTAYVWHFADWEGQLDYITKKTDGVEYKWLSDEYFDFFEAL